ncbi:hypothetical protein EB29_00288 [Enterococcus faecalis]|nr:hypothetical protein EB29_00288 [Enterococcus faecalis]
MAFLLLHNYTDFIKILKNKQIPLNRYFLTSDKLISKYAFY